MHERACGNADTCAPNDPGTGCGARHRKSPIGGAANGIPLKTRTSLTAPGTPEIKPSWRRTGSSIAAIATEELIIAVINKAKAPAFCIITFIIESTKP
jgi:hypothetical protein